MARYIVRVELHGADSEDYDSLHEKMNGKGYSREIRDGKGAWFHLPTAEYTIVKTSTALNIRKEVCAIAGSVKTKYYVLVSEAANTSWWLAKK